MTSSRRYWATIVGGVFALALLARGVTWAVVELAGLRDRVEAKKALVANLDGELTKLPALETRVAELRSAVATVPPRLLAGNSDNVALADLSSRLDAIAGDHHARLLRLDPVPDSSAAGRLRRVRGRAVFETDFEGVAELLAVLEREAVIVVPEHAAITASEPRAGPETPERLEVELELSGWFLPPEDS